MKKLIILSVGSLMLSMGAIASDGAKELYINKCATCHTLSFPENKADMIAPPTPGVMFHMRERFDNDEKILAYMRNFVMNPTTKTSLKKETKRFGLMPSQKGLITREELDIVTKWMVDNVHMNMKEHKEREKKYKKQ